MASRKEYLKQYYWKNHDKMLEYQRNYRKGKEAMRKIKREANKESEYAKMKVYRKEHHDELLEYQRKWESENRDKVHAYHKKYYEANREKILERKREKRRALKNESTSGHVQERKAEESL